MTWRRGARSGWPLGCRLLCRLRRLGLSRTSVPSMLSQIHITAIWIKSSSTLGLVYLCRLPCHQLEGALFWPRRSRPDTPDPTPQTQRHRSDATDTAPQTGRPRPDAPHRTPQTRRHRPDATDRGLGSGLSHPPHAPVACKPHKPAAARARCTHEPAAPRTRRTHPPPHAPAAARTRPTHLSPHALAAARAHRTQRTRRP